MSHPNRTSRAARCGRAVTIEDFAAPRVEPESFSEDVSLTILRLYCVSFASPETHAWRQAVQLSLNTFGHHEGSIIGCALMETIDGIRCQRKSPFNFSDPRCEHCRMIVTEQESQILRALRAIRAREPNEAQAIGRQLLEDKNTRRFISALQRAADAIDRAEGLAKETIERVASMANA